MQLFGKLQLMCRSLLYLYLSFRYQYNKVEKRYLPGQTLWDTLYINILILTKICGRMHTPNLGCHLNELYYYYIIPLPVSAFRRCTRYNPVKWIITSIRYDAVTKETLENQYRS